MKTAFVLSGGGFKGCFQAGVISQLYKKGITPDVVYGTSVGSINAAGCAYLGPDRLIKHWLGMKSKGEALFPHGAWWLLYWHRVFWSSGLYSPKPLKQYLESIVGDTTLCDAVSCFVNLKPPGKIGYCSARQSTKADYIDSVLASAAIPMFIEPTNYCVDGGVREQTPLKKAMDDGATSIYVVLCNPWVTDPLEDWKPSRLFPLIGVGFRAIDDLMCHEIFINDIQNNVQECKRCGIDLHLYAPDRVWMSTLEFSKDKIKSAIESGQCMKEVVLY